MAIRTKRKHTYESTVLCYKAGKGLYICKDLFR
jgi:hypothetical protein